jgi:uncharacterized protein YjeT (DUF2065 family)
MQNETLQKLMIELKLRARAFWAWLTQDKHKEKLKELSDEVEQAFTEHPQEAGETYWQHLWFTLTMSLRLTFAGLVLVIHGLFPFLLTKSASNQVEYLYRVMKTRIPKARREALDDTI